MLGGSGNPGEGMQVGSRNVGKGRENPWLDWESEGEAKGERLCPKWIEG